LKKKELQNELRGRELNTTGLKDELRQRLIDSMMEERQNSNAARHLEEERDEEGTKEICESMDSASLSERVNENNVALNQAKDVEMQDAADGDNNENHLSAPMEVDAVSIKISGTNENNPPMKGDEPMDVCGSAEKTKESSQSCVVKPLNETDPQQHLNKAQPASPTRAASRSPLRRMQTSMQSSFKNRMQTTVQSALKNLRPVSPKKPTAESAPKKSPKPKNQIVVVPEVISNDEIESSKSTSSEDITTKVSISTGPKVPASQPAQRTLTTTPVLASSGTFSAASKLGSLNINSDSVKAKNDARMARIAEIRNKVRIY
jgi:hypothetical protein